MLMLLVGLAVVTAPVALAAPEKLNWGSKVNASQCEKSGSPIVNITQKVTNSVDSGQGGNYWAFSNYKRTIQLWETTTADRYCAVVRYTGKFDGEAGQTSPGAGGILDGDEDGTFQGGYQATIDGTLKDNPGWKTKGSVGTADYDCNISGTCPGAVNWIDQYFDSGYVFGYDWWGWIYHGGSHGTWVNSCPSCGGNSGDIN